MRNWKTAVPPAMRAVPVSAVSFTTVPLSLAVRWAAVAQLAHAGSDCAIRVQILCVNYCASNGDQLAAMAWPADGTAIGWIARSVLSSSQHGRI